MKPIRIGLIGAGLFARLAHIPALLALPDRFEIAAICSRTPESAATVNALLPKPVPVYHEMLDLLRQADEQIEAVDILLPIPLIPRAVKMALAAGKHVFSEKPLAPTVDAGLDLLDFYGHHTGQIWVIGENWRYAPAINRAAEILRSGVLGKIALASWAIFAGSNKIYQQTPWRTNNSFPGGFLLDGGIHFAAALRTLFGEVTSVQARTAQVRAELPPADTLTATFRFDSGLLASLALTYAAGVPWGTFLTIAGEFGTLEVNRDGLRLTIGDKLQEELSNAGNGIQTELEAFADAVRLGQPHRNTPQETLLDLALAEAWLRSAEQGIAISPRQLVDG
jgi:predicted dehydrogenase